jgi:hypothetical protein
MNKDDKDWARAKIFQIIDTPTAELLAEDPRDKLVARKNGRDNHALDSMRLAQGPRLKREKYSHEQEQMQLFAKYLAEALRKQGNNKYKND